MCDALLLKKLQASKTSIECESDTQRDILSVVWFCFYGVVQLINVCFDWLSTFGMNRLIYCHRKLVTSYMVRTWCNTVNV